MLKNNKSERRKMRRPFVLTLLPCLIAGQADAQTAAQQFEPDRAALMINQSAASLAQAADYWRAQATQLQSQVGVLNRKIDELSKAQKPAPQAAVVGVLSGQDIYAVPFQASALSSAIALPPGAYVEFYNSGPAAAFCKLGASAATEASTADDELAPGAPPRRLKVRANTHAACITRDGTAGITLYGRAADGDEKN
jgi:hypothetical protein